MSLIELWKEKSAQKEEIYQRKGKIEWLIRVWKWKFKSQGKSASEKEDVSEKRKKINENYTTKLSWVIENEKKERHRILIGRACWIFLLEHKPLLQLEVSELLNI